MGTQSVADGRSWQKKTLHCNFNAFRTCCSILPETVSKSGCSVMRDLLLFAFGVGDALGRGSFAVQFCFWQWNSLRPWTKLPLSSDVYSCFRFRKGGLGPGPTPSAERQLVVLSDSDVRLVSGVFLGCNPQSKFQFGLLGGSGPSYSFRFRVW